MSKHYHNIKLAELNGFWWDEDTQELVTPRGTRHKPILYGKQRYPSYTTGFGSFLIHKFVAYKLFGEDALLSIVRHLDGNTLNLQRSNLALGTHSENNLDKSPEVRKNAAVKARASQGKRPLNAFFSEKEVVDILFVVKPYRVANKRLPRGLVKQISEAYNRSIYAVQAIVLGKSFPDIYKEVIYER
jgi:HNH endonuclease